MRSASGLWALASVVLRFKDRSCKRLEETARGSIVSTKQDDTLHNNSCKICVRYTSLENGAEGPSWLVPSRCRGLARVDVQARSSQHSTRQPFLFNIYTFVNRVPMARSSGDLCSAQI